MGRYARESMELWGLELRRQPRMPHSKMSAKRRSCSDGSVTRAGGRPEFIHNDALRFLDYATRNPRS